MLVKHICRTKREHGQVGVNGDAGRRREKLLNLLSLNGSLAIFILGFGSLILGLAIYMFARDCDTCPIVMFLDRNGAHHLSKEAHAWLPGWLPSFFHVFGFSLITNALLTADDDFVGFSVIFWAVINFIFEFAQWDDVNLAWMQFNDLIGTNFGPYWPIHGTFSVADLLGIVAGGVAAYMTIRTLRSSGLSIQTLSE